MSARHPHFSTTAPRYAATAEENKQLVHAWAHQLRRELPADHPAQGTLTAVIKHNYVPPFPVAKPMEAAREAANRDTSALVFFGVGAGLLIAAGKMVDDLPILAGICGVVGLTAQCVAFGLAQPE